VLPAILLCLQQEVPLLQGAQEQAQLVLVQVREHRGVTVVVALVTTVSSGSTHCSSPKPAAQLLVLPQLEFLGHVCPDDETLRAKLLVPDTVFG
jgi:hypothetical protein